MKVLTVVGARPQFIKAAPVSRVLRERHTEVLIHTGQHYDDAMSAAFFRVLELPAPDLDLEGGSGWHGAMVGEMLRRLEPALVEHEPDGVLVYGDTNSTLAGAIAAAKVAFADGRRPWLAHVEAGLRSFNRAMPEERNRIVADHLADLLLAPTDVAMEHLAREGLSARAELVGDVMVDAFAWAQARAEGRRPAALAGEAGDAGGAPYVLLTLHRAENVDDPARLAAWLEAMRAEMRVIFPVPPRTRAAMNRAGVTPPENVVLAAPAGYLDMVALTSGAKLVATDSGGLQKEAYLAGVPCVTLRGETEWTETMEAGWNRLADARPGMLHNVLSDTAFLRRDRPRPPLFGAGDAAHRIVASLERLDAETKQLDRRASERRRTKESPT
jgi:UDP-N-acetylglucosamine 2-epimerase